jgi:hypothetical protein
MHDFDEYEIISPTVPVGVSFVLTPVEVEIALATNGRSLLPHVMSALIAHLVVENEQDADAQRLAKAS